MDKASKSDYVITIISLTLLEFFDSDSYVLRAANAGMGQASLGHRTGGGSRHKCRELSGLLCSTFLNETNKAQSRSQDVEEFIDVDTDVFRLQPTQRCICGGRAHGGV